MPDSPVPARLRRAAESARPPGWAAAAGWAGCRRRPLRHPGRSLARVGRAHTGFTGTSLALDSPSGAWVILLTNAVHSGRDNTAIKALRRDVHGAVAAGLFGDVRPDAAAWRCGVTSEPGVPAQAYSGAAAGGGLLTPGGNEPCTA